MAVNRLSTQYAYFRWVLATILYICTLTHALQDVSRHIKRQFKKDFVLECVCTHAWCVHVIHVADTVQTFLQKYAGPDLDSCGPWAIILGGPPLRTI